MVVLTQVRRRVIEETLAVAATDSHVERREIPWRAGKKLLPVVSLRVDHVVLNPRSHRIQAQLKSNPAWTDLMAADPFGAPAQDVIAQIIKETPGYERIRKLLSQEPQREPGMVTTAGVLINANTRVVALRELNREYVKVQVLPADANEIELADLELSLQMEVESKQPYSFTNRLLFIRDLLRTHQPEDVGLKLDPALSRNIEADRKKATAEVETSARLLNMIENVIHDSGGALTYEFFDGEQQNVKDIDIAYEALLRRGQPQLADRVRRAKIAGMLAEMDYRKVRDIDATLLSDYVVGALREQPLLKDHVALLTTAEPSDHAAADVTGLDILDDLDDLDDFDSRDDEAGAGVVTLEPVYRLLAATPKDGEVKLPAVGDSPAKTLAREVFSKAVFAGLNTALMAMASDSKHGTELESPYRRLMLAARACDQVKEAVARVNDRSDVDLDKVKSALGAFERARDEMVMVLEQFGVSIDDGDLA
ncbi:hypothetical protein [Catellatospora vulcania]|uniref:hypothetical protein n=1 Tax=Catellatospora vulcania TaxID=1460450 RepID=UPI0012D3993C|nr:hypothetical protein [Catellatospora vulcania]